MRVIAGKYRSRPLHALRGMDIRPTSDRLRETLFNVLTAGNPDALEGSVWLDLFAGNGRHRHRSARAAARRTCTSWRIHRGSGSIFERILTASGSQEVNIVEDELPRAFWRMERQRVAADVVFIDPPYRMQDVYAKTLRALADSSLIWAMSVVIAEHEKKFDPGDEFGPLRRFRHLVQGSAALSFYRMGNAAEVRM